MGTAHTTATTRTTTTAHQPARPFDARTSATLDQLITALERNPNRGRRRILQLRKLVAEHRIPTYYPNGGAR